MMNDNFENWKRRVNGPLPKTKSRRGGGGRPECPEKIPDSQSENWCHIILFLIKVESLLGRNTTQWTTYWLPLLLSMDVCNFILFYCKFMKSFLLVFYQATEDMYERALQQAILDSKVDAEQQKEVSRVPVGLCANSFFTDWLIEPVSFFLSFLSFKASFFACHTLYQCMLGIQCS